MSTVRGIVPAVLTPFDERLRPDAQRAVPYYRSLLERGCGGLNVLGTTGEAMSIGLRDRLRFMEDVRGGLRDADLFAGTGASALADAAELTGAAFALGFAAALVIPPFYYRDVSADGVVAFFDELFARVRPPHGGIFLYNFPRMSGVTFDVPLVTRLLQEFPGILGGMKDSSNDAALERRLRATYPEFSIFPGSEERLPEAIEYAMGGCISASVCLWPEEAARAWTACDVEAATAVAKRRAAIDRPMIPFVRSRVARELGDDSWLRSIPPVTA